MTEDLAGQIFTINDDESFSCLALEIFRFQAEKNPVYRSFVESLGINPAVVNTLTDIPFLPSEIFRTRKVILDGLEEKLVFESSMTAGSSPCRHYVHDPALYETSFLKSFKIFYGDPSDYLIAAILPSYTERQNSSLVYMMNGLIRLSGDKSSGFYKEDRGKLIYNINKARLTGRKTFLIGVSFALLDLANDLSPDLAGTIVMETGGMKGRRKEITRDELHGILKEKFNVGAIHSEYGMTELLSQAYSAANGVFYCPPWMKILIRDTHDPLNVTVKGRQAGGINIIDLANIFSCSFIATGDYGRLTENGGFEVSGRFDNTDIRGCNLMAD
ncbi:MAG TPA: acyltransferase [Bacteroidales bacterium]|jgi:hypothetical protein|nr:acyltransferase [Bacteroidales bacterium]